MGVSPDLPIGAQDITPNQLLAWLDAVKSQPAGSEPSIGPTGGSVVDTDGTASSYRLYIGTGAPPAGLGQSGEYYHRKDTPTTVNQRLYVNNGGTWTGIV